MDWMRSISREVAVVAIAMLIAVCALVIFGHVKLVDIGAFGTTIIGAIILANQKLAAERYARIEQNTNGTNAALQAKYEESQRTIAQLIAKLPPDAALPASLYEKRPADVVAGEGGSA